MMSDEAEVKVDSAPVADVPADTGPDSISDPGHDNSDWNIGAEHPETEGSALQDNSSPAAAEPAKPDDGFSQDLLEYASTFGFERKDFDSPRELSRAVGLAQRLFTQQSNQTGQARPTPEQMPAASVGAATVAPHQPNAGAATPGQFQFKVPPQLLDDKLYDKEIVEFARAVDGLNGHYEAQTQKSHAEVAQLRGLMGEMLTHHQQQQAERFFDEVDKLITSDESLVDVLGKGDRHAALTDAQLNERRALIEQMDLVQRLYSQQGKPAPSPEKSYAIAKGIRYHDKQTQIARRQIADQLRDSKGRFSAPPAHSPNAAIPHGPDRARAAIAKAMRDSPIFANSDETGLLA
jgi:hypothetical protein